MITAGVLETAIIVGGILIAILYIAYSVKSHAQKEDDGTYGLQKTKARIEAERLEKQAADALKLGPGN